MDFGIYNMLLKCLACWYTAIYIHTSPRPLKDTFPDKTGERFFHIAAWWWGVILGFMIALSTMSIAARYVSLFLMACGYVGQFIGLISLQDLV